MKEFNVFRGMKEEIGLKIKTESRKTIIKRERTLGIKKKMIVDVYIKETIESLQIKLRKMSQN